MLKFRSGVISQPLLIGVGAAVILALSAGGYLWYAQSGDFSVQKNVTATDNLRFDFAEAMDHASVEASMSVPSGLNGSWSWDGEVLIFDPSELLIAGGSYEFVLDGSTLKADGTKLGHDWTFRFVVAGAPKVAAAIPAKDSKNIDPDSSITLVFDRPMIPLTQVQGEAAEIRFADWPVTIVPEVKGHWRWISTMAIEYLPEDGLDPATNYTVNVPKGISTVLGDETQEDFSWSFETIRPELTISDPFDGFDKAGPKTEIVMHFNQPMDLAKVRAAFLLKNAASGKPVDIKPLVYGKKSEDGKKVTDTTMVIAIPASPLPLNTNFIVTLTPDLHAAEGNLGTTQEIAIRFKTAGPLTVQGSRQYGELAFDFSNPVDEAVFKKAVSVTPAIKDWDDLSWNLEWSEYRAYVYPELEPSTTYTVTIAKTLKDKFGQSLAEPYVYTFTTPPLDPRVFIHSEGEFGIFERGKPPVYYLNAVNVSRLDLEFAKLSLPEFLNIRQQTAQQYKTPRSALAVSGMQTKTIKHTAKENEWKSVPFGVEQEFGTTLAPGIYGLSMRSPEYVETWGDGLPIMQFQFFALTNMAITLKFSGNEALVWVTDMQTGAPVPGATISFLSLLNKVSVTGTTDAEGFFQTTLDMRQFIANQDNWEPEFWVTAEKDGDFAFVGSKWNYGLEPYSFGINSDFRGPLADKYIVDSYLYTERPVYRAGDSVSFKGMLRLRDIDGTYSIPQGASVQLKIADANNNEVYNERLPVNAFGSINGTLKLDGAAALGDYYMSGELYGSNNLIIPGYMYDNFAVLAYRKPEYRIDLTAEKENYFDDETVKATIEGAYYFGAPMDGATVTWRALTTDYFFNQYRDGWYSFGLEDNWCWWECDRGNEMIMEGTGTLDATGHMTVSVPVNIDDKSVSQVLTIEADVTDQNNQIVSNRVSVPVHKSDVYVGIRSTDWGVAPGEEASIDVVTVAPDGNPMPNQSVELQLLSREWNSIRSKGVDGEYYYDNEAKDTYIRSERVTTDEAGKATARIRIDEGGQFRIVAIAKGSGGREAKAATYVYAWSSTYVNWPHTNSDRMDIVVDKPEYAVGDTATLIIKSPYQGQGVKALITVERESIQSHKVIDITSSAQAIEIPITEDLLPNAYVSVVVIKPRIGETFNEHGLDTGAPAFKVGYATLRVETSRKAITIDIQPDRRQYAPGETVNIELTAADYQGKPVKAELSLAAVDMSVLALTGFELPDLVRTFYAERPLGVYTSHMLMYLLERFKPGSKGGGGGDPESRKRENFLDTAYWNPVIVTDDQGKATVSFKLPDNLTTWHLLAIGSTKDHLFGAIDTTFIETKKVIVRPIRPRFAVGGDKISLGAIVHNFLPESATFTVTLSGDGFTSEGELTQQVTISSGEQKEISFPVTATIGESMKLNFLAQSGESHDEIEETIPVYLFGNPQSVATAGMTDDVTTEKVLVPSKKDAASVDTTVTVSATVATYLPSSLEFLMEYPYGCTEQTVSAFLPALALRQLQGFDAFQFVDDKVLQDRISSYLQRIYSFQQGDGGFGFWQESYWSDAYLSAYVLYALSVAERSGISVDNSVIARDRTYLNAALRSNDPTRPISLATRAYILYVLSETGNVDQSLLNNLYEQRNELPLFSRAHLAMAYKNLSGGAKSAKASDLLTDIINSAKVSSRGTHFEEENSSRWESVMHTNQRSTAIIFQAMVRIEPTHAFVQPVLRWLLSVRKEGHWDTTQSTTMSVLALVDYLKATNELDAAYTADLHVNGKDLLDWTVNKDNVLTRKEVVIALQDFKRGELNDIVIDKEGNGRLYYDLLMSYFYTADTIPPAEEGMSISRTIRPVKGNVKDFRVGETYRVTLTMTVPQDHSYVAVESPLPAGMEIIDLSLNTSQKELLQGQDSEIHSNDWWWNDAYWESGLYNFNHKEFRDDRAFLFSDYLPAGVYQYHYLVRATTPGKFRYRPAKIWKMYLPEVFGQTAGDWFTIKE